MKDWENGRGELRDLFQELNEHGINTMGIPDHRVGRANQGIGGQDARGFIALNPTFYQVVPLHPVPGTPLWDRLKSEDRLLDNHFLESEGVGDYTFSLKNFSSDQAKALVSDTYSGLVEEGGPWPFRLAENLLQGHLNLINADSLIYRQRAAAYWKMLLPILPLVLLSGFMFRGKPFQERHRKFRRSLRSYSPIRYHLALATGLALWPDLDGDILVGAIAVPIGSPTVINRTRSAGCTRLQPITLPRPWFLELVQEERNDKRVGEVDEKRTNQRHHNESYL